MHLSLFHDQKGQSFEPFKMLIGAVMALAVLVIIIGAITYFSELRVTVSKQRFFDGLANAVKQPNGSPFMIEDVQMQRGESFSSAGLGNYMGLEGECVTFADPISPVFEVSGSSITIRDSIVTNVFVTCDVSESDVCEVECSISFEEAE